MGEIEKTSFGLIDEIALDDIKNELNDYNYALIYGISEMVFCPITEENNRKDIIASSILDDCIEAFIFNEKGQIHLYRDGDKLIGKKYEELSGFNDFVDKKYELTKEYIPGKKYVIIREYFESDDDGQIRIAYVKLVDLV